MKLRNLTGAIRKHTGAIRLNLCTAHGVIACSLVKSDLIVGLTTLHTDPGEETGLILVDGTLGHETDGDRFSARVVRSAESGYFIDPDQTDIEDLIGDGPSTFDDDLLGDDAGDLLDLLDEPTPTPTLDTLDTLDDDLLG